MARQSAYAEYSEALQSLFLALDRGEHAPLYLFHGQDEFLVSQGARALAHRLVPLEERALHLNLAAWDEEGRRTLAEFMATRSLFAPAEETTVLLLNDPPAAGQAEAEDLLRLLQPGPPPGNVLIAVVRQALAERNPLVQLAANLGVAVPVPALRTAADRKYFISRRLAHEGLRAGEAAVQRLDWMVGNDTRAVAQEARKLALYLYPDNTVTERELDLVVSPTAEVHTYELADAVAKGQPGQVIALLRRMHEAGTQPAAVVNQLSRALRRMLQARLLLDRGLVDPGALRRGFDPFARWLDKNSAQLAPLLPDEPSESLLAQNRYAAYRQFLAAERTDPGTLIGGLQALLQCEVLLKSTAYLPEWDALMEVAVAIAARVPAPLLELSA